MATIVEFPFNAVLQRRSSLSGFRARAVIDFIEIEIQTRSPTNFHTVQDRLSAIQGDGRKIWVEGLDEGPGGAATRFGMRLHNPATFEYLRDIINRLDLRFPLVSRPKVRVIEIAADFYSRESDRADLEAMVLRLKHNLCADGYKEIESDRSTNRLENVTRLRPDRTLVIERDGVLWRVYLKDIDNKKPIEDPNEHRARIEINLSGNGLPPALTLLDDIASFRFESLTPLFSFRRFIANDRFSAKPTTAAEVAEHRHQVLATRRGHRELPAPAKRERRKHHKLTKADRALKEHVRGALRDLTRRLNAGKPERITPIPH